MMRYASCLVLVALASGASGVQLRGLSNDPPAEVEQRDRALKGALYVPRGLQNASASAAARRRYLASKNKGSGGGGGPNSDRAKNAAVNYLKSKGFNGVNRAAAVPLGGETDVVAVHTQQEAHGLPVKNSEALLIVNGETGEVIKSVTNQGRGRIKGVKGAIEAKARLFDSEEDMSLEELIRESIHDGEGDFECDQTVRTAGQWDGWTECA